MQVQDSYVTQVRAYPNEYEVGDIVLFTLCDHTEVCEVTYKGSNYLSLLPVNQKAPCPQSFRIYEKEIDSLRKLK